MNNLQQNTELQSTLQMMGEFFRTQRMIKRDKQATVSRAVGISQGVLSQIEQGVYYPLTISLVIRLLSYYHLQPKDMAQKVLEKMYVSAAQGAD